MPSTLFVQSNDSQSFDAFSKRIFALLNIEIKETRYSVNYPGGRYLYGEALGLEIELSEADSSGFPDYQFRVDFDPKIDWRTIDRQCLDGLADIVAKYLAQNGMKIARPLQPGRAGTPSILYGDGA